MKKRRKVNNILCQHIQRIFLQNRENKNSSSRANSMHRESSFLKHSPIQNLSRNGGDRDTFQPKLIRWTCDLVVNGALSIETLRETNTRFTVCITKYLHLSALLIPLSLKGYRKQDM